MGCAETGSGKTAAFALPILHHLSQDPYGVFAIVLTPTRELAIQISEQFGVLGAAVGVRIALVIGGQNMMVQGAELAKRPHVVIATPGRLRHHMGTRLVVLIYSLFLSSLVPLLHHSYFSMNP